MYLYTITGDTCIPASTPRTCIMYISLFIVVQIHTSICKHNVQQWFSTWGTRVICDTLTLKIVTLRLYFYATLLIQKYKENDT